MLDHIVFVMSSRILVLSVYHTRIMPAVCKVINPIQVVKTMSSVILTEHIACILSIFPTNVAFCERIFNSTFFFKYQEGEYGAVQVSFLLEQLIL